MKNFKFLAIVVIMALSLSSCSFRLVDFTAISSKNVDLNIDRSKGKKVEGSKSYFLGIGWNIKDARDKALESAGPDYDLLIDGVVRYTSYPFVASVKVEGTAVSSKSMMASLGEEGYKEWLSKQNVFDHENAKVASEETKK